MSAVVWVIREGKLRLAHVLLDNLGACPSARMPPGTVTAYQGRKVRPFVVLAPDELNADGWPYGPVCTLCERRARIALGLSTHCSRNPGTPNPTAHR